MMMDNYTIRCSDEQTRKARKLGASLEYTYGNCGLKHYINPTADQMLGWLDEKEVYIEIVMSTEDWQWSYLLNKGENGKMFYTRKEAVKAAIDEALDYLANKH